jgi:hypothetical protein
MDTTDSLARQNSGEITIEPLSPISPDVFTVVTAWVGMIHRSKNMQMPEENVLLLVWLEPLSSYRPEVIDQAFRGYLADGVGEWFDVHAIIRRCQAIEEIEQRKFRAERDGRDAELKRLESREYEEQERRRAAAEGREYLTPWQRTLKMLHDVVEQHRERERQKKQEAEARYEQRRAELKQQAQELQKGTA